MRYLHIMTWIHLLWKQRQETTWMIWFFLPPSSRNVHNRRNLDACLCEDFNKVLHITKWNHSFCKQREDPTWKIFVFNPWWQNMHNSGSFSVCVCEDYNEILHITKWSHALCKQRHETTWNILVLTPLVAEYACQQKFQCMLVWRLLWGITYNE